MSTTTTPPKSAQEAARRFHDRPRKTNLERKREAAAKRNAEAAEATDAPSEAAIDICTGLLERRKEAIERMLRASEEIREIDTTLAVLGAVA